MGGDRGFQLAAHFIGNRRSVEAVFDGYSWTVETASGPVSVRDIDHAIRIARQSIGELLRKVGRRPGWGLRVEVVDVAASYGEPDPEEVSFPSGGRADSNSLVARIRGRWRNGDSPEAALDNALDIVRGYAGKSRRSAAA